MLLAYYGDDFTGSTDVLETLAAAGLDADLCVSPTAAAERLAGGSLPAAEAMGIAGLSRTFSPGEMEAALPAAFATLASASPRFLHYKVCSTFDSTPKTGSIGRAIEIGRRVLPARWTPVVVAAPHLGRWSDGRTRHRCGLGRDHSVSRWDRALRCHHHLPPGDDRRGARPDAARDGTSVVHGRLVWNRDGAHGSRRVRLGDERPACRAAAAGPAVRDLRQPFPGHPATD
jgi:hypothetical protein